MKSRLLASSYLSVCMEHLGPHWTDFHWIWYLSIFRKNIEKIQVSLNMAGIIGTLREDQFTFFIIHLSSSRNKKRLKLLEKIKTHVLFSKIFSENRAVYKIMWNKVRETGRPQKTIWRIRIAWWITKSKNRHSEFLTHCLSTPKIVAQKRLGVMFRSTLPLLFKLSLGHSTFQQKYQHKVIYDAVQPGKDLAMLRRKTRPLSSIFCDTARDKKSDKLLPNYTDSHSKNHIFLFIVKTWDVIEAPCLGIFSNIHGKVLKSVSTIFTPCSTVLLEKLIRFQLIKKFLVFMETEDSLPHSQVLATCPYPEPARSSTCPYTPLPEYP